MNSRSAAVSASDLSALVRQAQHGDQAALSALYSRYRIRVECFARNFVRQKVAAEDIAQNVFIKMLRRLPMLRDVDAFEAWLFMMARSTALDYLRHERRHPEELVDSFEEMELTESARPRLMADILEALQAALAELPALDRRLFQLLLEGNSYEFIAAHSGLTLGAVKTRFNRMRRFLRLAVGSTTETRLEKHAPVIAMPATRHSSGSAAAA